MLAGHVLRPVGRSLLLHASTAARAGAGVAAPLYQSSAAITHARVHTHTHAASSAAAQPIAAIAAAPLDVPAAADAASSPRAAIGGIVASTGAGASRKRESLLHTYAELGKARLSSLVVFTSGAGYLMAGLPASYPVLAATVIGTSFAAAAAGTFNQVMEIRTDGMMKRTARRPLPAGRITVPHALAFGGGMTLASGALLSAATNPLTAVLGVSNIALYSLVYTPMKLRSPLNTAVGAVVGAIPPVMGWTAATYTGAPWDMAAWASTLLAPEPLLLALALFWWQFPHFYSLSWTLRKDYARGGYAMVPCTDTTGGKKTAWLSLRSSVALAMLPLASTALGATAPMFAVEGVALNAYFLRVAYKFYQDPSDATARKLFLTSLWYLPLLLILAVFHSRHWMQDEKEATEQAHADAATLQRTGFGTADEQLSRLVAERVAAIRDLGRALCLHEMAAKGDSISKPSVVLGAVYSAVSAQPDEMPLGAPSDPALEAAAAAAKEATRGRCPLTGKTTEAPLATPAA